MSEMLEWVSEVLTVSTVAYSVQVYAFGPGASCIVLKEQDPGKGFCVQGLGTVPVIFLHLRWRFWIAQMMDSKILFII